MNRVLLLLGIVGLLCLSNRSAKGQIRKCNTVIDPILHKLVYLNTDTIPKPTEEYGKFQSAIFKQIKLNNDYKEYTGRVIIAFVVEPNGRINGIRVPRDIPGTNYFFSNQIVKAIKKYKRKWDPGVCNGKRVPVLVTMPFHINI